MNIKLIKLNQQLITSEQKINEKLNENELKLKLETN
jgi:hypothetical protein